MRAVIDLEKKQFRCELSQLDKNCLERAAAMCNVLKRFEDDNDKCTDLNIAELTLLRYVAQPAADK